MPEALQIVKPDSGLTVTPELIEGFLETLAELADQRLDLLTEWDGEKNAPLSPWTVSYGSKKRVWWTCPDGHVWKAMVYSRGSVQRSGCPVCAGQGRRSRTLHR